MKKQLFDNLISNNQLAVTITYIVAGEEITEFINITSVDKDTLYYDICENDTWYEESVSFNNIINVLY